MDNLVIQSFGRESEYRRAVLTILSYYAYSSQYLAETNVLLFTDRPEFFEAYVKGLPVQCFLLTPEKIKEMRGEDDFLHRIKIAVIEKAFALTNGNILYLDSDTFFIADPTPLAQQLAERKMFMHLLEYPFIEEVEDKTPTYKSFYKLINSREFILTNGQSIKVMPQHCSWNAGVMFFHPSHAALIPDVYALTDQFYSGSQSHASEQYAFSVVMQENAELGSCDDVVYHYWYRIKKQIIDSFLGERLKSEWAAKPLSNKLAEIKQWTEYLPVYFEQHVLTIRDKAIQHFNEKKYRAGYKWALKALLKDPYNKGFLKDILYHTKNCTAGKKQANR